MKALIKLEGIKNNAARMHCEETQFLLKAFNVLREVAKDTLDDHGYLGNIDDVFEKRMSDV